MEILKRLLRKSRKINVENTNIDKNTYLMDYRKHYSKKLGNHINKKIISELFLFRAWTSQFGYTIFSSDPKISEKIIYETINTLCHFGLGVFEQIHHFSIEKVFEADFMDLIEERWRSYDLVVSTNPSRDKLPTIEIISQLCKWIDVSDPTVTYELSTDFLSQLDNIKKKAIELGILR